MAVVIKPLEVIWRTDMEAAPKRRPILVKFDHDANPYQEPGSGGRRLTTYGAHCEGIGFMRGKGFALVVWGGGYRETVNPGDGGNDIYIPDWWFEANSDFELAVNPIAWASNVDLFL